MDENVKPAIAVSLKNVNKVYRLYKRSRDKLRSTLGFKVNYIPRYAVNDVSFDIYRGESVAFLGRNGAGKSTILKLVTGVSYPTSGYIRINGRVCALLELTAGFDPELSGIDNIYLKAGILGIPADEIKQLEEDIIDFAELGQYIYQPVRTYSSGMKARLGFAVNISLKPDILIVDEALSVGDEDFRNKCRDKISQMVSEGVTLLFVTHSREEAKAFCKRGIVLHKGHAVLDAPIEEAVDYYTAELRSVQRERIQAKKAAAQAKTAELKRYQEGAQEEAAKAAETEGAQSDEG